MIASPDSHPAPVQGAPGPRAPIDLPLGQIVATPGALEAMARVGQDPALLLNRHRTGDWGDVDADDRAANDFAVDHHERILSAYALQDGTRIWIISEFDPFGLDPLAPQRILTRAAQIPAKETKP